MITVLWWQGVVLLAILIVSKKRGTGTNNPYWLLLGLWQTDLSRAFLSISIVFALDLLLEENRRLRFGYFNYWINMYMKGYDNETCNDQAQRYCQLTQKIVHRERLSYKEFFESKGFVLWSRDLNLETGTIEGDTKKINGVSIEL